MQGQICDIPRPQLAMNHFLPFWPHRFPHFGSIHRGRGVGVGALILDRCRAFDLFASVDAHLCCTCTVDLPKCHHGLHVRLDGVGPVCVHRAEAPLLYFLYSTCMVDLPKCHHGLHVRLDGVGPVCVHRAEAPLCTFCTIQRWEK